MTKSQVKSLLITLLEEAKKNSSSQNPVEFLEQNEIGKNVVNELSSKLESVEKETDVNSEYVEKVNKEIDDFVYIISHDLKAPIRAIVNLSQWIEDDIGQSISEDSKKMMELMKGRVNRMQNLINSLLQYSRVTRPADIQKDIQLDKVVDEIIGKIQSEKTFNVQRAVTLPVIDHNPVWIENLFSHLIHNAIQHHDKENANVHIHYENKEGYHWFKVNDDGPGIPDGSKEKIFGIFQTLESRDTHESTGVGLAIVKKILEKMGGEIWVESKEGEGASFNFRIPV